MGFHSTTDPDTHLKNLPQLFIFRGTSDEWSSHSQDTKSLNPLNPEGRGRQAEREGRMRLIHRLRLGASTAGRFFQRPKHLRTILHPHPAGGSQKKVWYERAIDHRRRRHGLLRRVSRLRVALKYRILGVLTRGRVPLMYGPPPRVPAITGLTDKVLGFAV